MRGGAMVGALDVTSSDDGPDLIREQCIDDEVLIRN